MKFLKSELADLKFLVTRMPTHTLQYQNPFKKINLSATKLDMFWRRLHLFQQGLSIPTENTNSFDEHLHLHYQASFPRLKKRRQDRTQKYRTPLIASKSPSPPAFGFAFNCNRTERQAKLPSGRKAYSALAFPARASERTRKPLIAIPLPAMAIPFTTPLPPPRLPPPLPTTPHRHH